MSVEFRTATDFEKLEADYQKWLAKNRAMPEQPAKYENLSWEKIKPLYTPLDTAHIDYNTEIGHSGEFPYTRSIHNNLYRGKLWTMRLFAGFATPEETNQRYKFLLERGQTGLSVAFDLPALMGWDCDQPLAKGEVGVCGVSVSSLADMEVVFDGIRLEDVSTSMTINSTAMVAMAYFIAVAQKQGCNLKNIRGTIQNDILKEYIAQKEYIYPPRPSMRIVTDMFGYSVKEMPKFNPVSVSGYHIREAGSTAVQELAFTLADGFAYLEHAIEAGIDVDDIAPKISFFFNSHNDFFEEIAKFRAARKIWAKRLRYKYGAKSERSWQLRFHTQTAGCTLTVQQPENNIVRVALQALAAVLGGTQSLHTNSMDEALALPSDKAVKIALRTQQIIAYETGVVNTVDPLGGSYYIESLTMKMEEEAEKYFEKIEQLGGVVAAIEKNFMQKEIADAAYRYQSEVDRKERIIVGVNEFQEPDEKIDIPILKISPEVEHKQIARLRDVKASRNEADVQAALSEIRSAAKDGKNLMPPLIHAAHNYVTLGEICGVLREEFGNYEETPVF
ncbi:MAG: methylmalonyl-CoA mutase [[Candidatus Thermochlorobacteriaceae] bacterium GBChlB]|nr:MAG: methylmalonyl-CoA mutase [[Candidatus Thermochlorobacteriaceae] bacterium GBChlB]